jgi:YesN/AraC family two-component response regulator
MSKLLLIDDEADVLYSIRRILDGSDIEVATASSGDDGLKAIPKFKPDLVLMDIRMGGRRLSASPHPADGQAPSSSS